MIHITAQILRDFYNFLTLAHYVLHMTEFTNNPSARDELQRVASQVGGFGPLADRIALEKEAEGLPQGTRKRNSILRRLRRDEPPTETQKDIKRFLGFGLVAALTAATFFLGQQSVEHFSLYQQAGTDFQNTLHHFDILHATDWANRLSTDVSKQIQNLTISLVEGAGTLGAFALDGVAVALKPWRAPRRRGRFF